MWKEVDDEKECLFALMLQVQEKLSKKRNGGRQVQPIAESDLRQCSWEQVLNEVNTTAERWKGSPDKESKTMVFIDKIGKYSGALETWLGLLPMGDYGSSICGVFKLAIGASEKAATQYSSTGEAIFQFLSDIPDIMENARQTFALYKEMGGHSLDRRSFELFRAVLSALNHIMQFFADSKMDKFFQVTIKQSAYKSDLQISVDNVRKQAHAFKEEAHICHARETHENSHLLARIKADNENFQKRLLQMLESSPLFRSNRSERLAPEHRSSTPRIAAYDMANVDYTVPGDGAESSLLLPHVMSQEVRNHLERRMADDKAESDAKRSKLYQILGYDENGVQQDIASCLRHGYRLEEKGKSKAAVLFQHRDFRSFVRQSKASTCLLVNGRDEIAASDGISPLSLAMAELMRISQAAETEMGQSFVIAFFCGEHRPRYSPDTDVAWHSSAIGLIASLIGQLLHQMTDKGARIDLSFLTYSKWRKLTRLEPKILCVLFKRLVKQMPPGTVVLCIVDEAAIYEIGGLQPHFVFIMDKLLQLVRSFADGPQIFKLLVTCQDRAVAVSQLFGDHILDLPETVDENDSAQYVISRIGLE
ncbi:uncharacterized protein LY79DRAFT_530827 [Colletotrichum navitas]|uniref:Uncharacterized protein n=1 Tax=Colletotrichum navitas TaxID=681940 RepID=A0AAD8UWZ4_9PEZI|nr:uncharacterized protein LY79DRAFT_530827 [Colletotrichum navitas]KAK1561753.1 hypothetical protein LY79DRAFT_530827 [Colletotrichum navitas]